MSDDDTRDGDSDGAPLGGTVMMDSGAGSSDSELDGTVMLDDGPSVAADGTVMIDAGVNPAAQGVRASPSSIEGRKSAPPPLPGAQSSKPPPLLADDTSLPPSLGPTPAAPQASDMTFDRSKLDADETTDESPKPAVSSSFFKPAVPASVKPAPAPKPAEPKPAAVKPAAAKPKEPAAKPKPAAKSAAPTTKATPPSQPATNAAAPPAARPRPKKFPMWAQLLALVVVAGAVGHLIARSQTESSAPAATAKPKPPPPPKQTATSRPTAVAPEPSTAPPPPVEPAPAPAPTKAADMSACVAKELGATLPSDKLNFVCEETDANRAQRDMSTLFVTIEDADRDARTAWNKYGWYRMAKLQIVRTRCCGDAAPMAITEALSACGLAESLTALHEADRNKTSYTEPVKAYKKAVDCLFKANTMRMFGIIARPGEYQEDAFVNSLTTP